MDVSLHFTSPVGSQVDTHFPQECRRIPFYSTQYENEARLPLSIVVNNGTKSVSLHCRHSLIQRRSLILLGFQPAGSQVDAHFPQESRCLPFHSTQCENEARIGILETLHIADTGYSGGVV